MTLCTCNGPLKTPYLAMFPFPFVSKGANELYMQYDWWYLNGIMVVILDGKDVFWGEGGGVVLCHSLGILVDGVCVCEVWSLENVLLGRLIVGGEECRKR